MKKDNLLSASTMVLLLLFIALPSYIHSIEGAVEPDAPFSIEVEPNKLSAKGGDEITFESGLVLKKDLTDP